MITAEYGYPSEVTLGAVFMRYLEVSQLYNIAPSACCFGESVSLPSALFFPLLSHLHTLPVAFHSPVPARI